MTTDYATTDYATDYATTDYATTDYATDYATTDYATDRHLQYPVFACVFIFLYAFA